DVTNRPPGDQTYPSALRVTAALPDRAKLEVEGRADFLAKPGPRVEAHVKMEQLSLERLLPVVQQYNVQLRGGSLDLEGEVQHTGGTTVVDIRNFVLDRARVDYVHKPGTTRKDVHQAASGSQAEKLVKPNPSLVVRVQHGKILHSDMGFVNKVASPEYRVFIADLNLDMENFSNRPEEGLGNIKLTGNFMGSGPTVVTGSFRPERPAPDFNVQVRIVKTKVQALNDLLRAYGKLDVKDGTFAFFSDMTVKGNRIQGYAKPFLKDVKVYDPQQDQDKGAGQKLYEAIVGGVLDLFSNTNTDEAATRTDISGPVQNPRANTWQVLEKLIQNAFFKAILPGFERESGRA
ncbi:MAG TPA: DUF748 domain-containing protein, partial [Nitrospira sp.]|nr:DUF748 domain-containing protein [Nitrospira sp.]